MYCWIFMFGPFLITSLIPQPQIIQLGTDEINTNVICSIEFEIGSHSDHLIELTRQYKRMFQLQNNCKSKTMANQQKFYVSISVMEEIQHYFINETKQEQYILKFDSSLNVKIRAETHWGVARALATFHQLIQQPYLNIPIYVEDSPSILIRGIMIDTSRHYFELDLLKQTIDSMMLNKLNVLHWHLTDDESFPLQLDEYTIITDTTKYDQNSVYTKEDIATIIEYASIRGVQIIPEIDSPAHTRSWGQNTKISRIVIDCTSVTGQLDPTNDLTYTVLESIMREANDMFKKTQFFHLGGDEASYDCYEAQQSVKDAMVQKRISNYIELSNIYRKKQKEIWRQKVKSTKRVIYWYNKKESLKCEEDDIIQWWGLPEDLACVSHLKNDFILSFYHPLYLDVGQANAYGDRYDSFQTWKDIYTLQLNPPDNFQGRIQGFILALWGETNNGYTHFQKLFPRASVFADILWNINTRSNEQYYDFAYRLGQMEDFMISQGYPISPYTSQFCKKNTVLCFYKTNREIKALPTTCSQSTIKYESVIPFGLNLLILNIIF